MADSNSCALVIRLRKEKRVVALPKVKFVDKNLSFQEVFTDVYDGDLDVRVKCRVGFKKPGDAEPKDFVSVDLAENVGAIVNALSANFVDFDALDEKPQAKAVKPLNAFDVLMKAASTKILPPEIGAEEQANPTQWVELHNRLLQLAKILYPGADFPPAEVKSSGACPFWNVGFSSFNLYNSIQLLLKIIKCIKKQILHRKSSKRNSFVRISVNAH